MKRAIIDGDYYLYAAGFATEGEPVSHSCQALKTMIRNILEELGISEYQIYISGKGNFREDVAVSQGYKANRSRKKPTNYEEMRSYLKDAMGAQEVDGMEADDKVSMLLWEDYIRCGGVKPQAEVVCCSVDKDLNNTPGWHYQSTKKKLFWVNERQALRHFWYQMLAGDKVDNIQGLPDGTDYIRATYGLRKYPGFGDGSAKKVLAKTITAAEAAEAAITCYISWGVEQGLSKASIREYIVEQGLLLWMARELDPFGQPDLFELDEEMYDRLYDRYTRWGEAETDSGELAVSPQGTSGTTEGAGCGDGLRGASEDSTGRDVPWKEDDHSSGSISGKDDSDGELLSTRHDAGSGDGEDGGTR